MALSIKELEKMQVGETYYECQYGMNKQIMILTEPKWDQHHVQLTWTARNEENNVIEYLITEGFEHYGPRIYRTPIYG